MSDGVSSTSFVTNSEEVGVKEEARDENNSLYVPSGLAAPKERLLAHIPPISKTYVQSAARRESGVLTSRRTKSHDDSLIYARVPGLTCDTITSVSMVIKFVLYSICKNSASPFLKSK